MNLEELKLSSSRGRTPLARHWAQPNQWQNGVRRVVEALDVMKDGVFSLLPGCKSGQMNHLAFEAAKEVFRNRIVVWITLSRHTGRDA
ncbi:MAG: hypothetical protein RR224_13125, partial [Clostridia bacterium]